MAVVARYRGANRKAIMRKNRSSTVSKRSDDDPNEIAYKKAKKAASEREHKRVMNSDFAKNVLSLAAKYKSKT